MWLHAPYMRMRYVTRCQKVMRFKIYDFCSYTGSCGLYAGPYGLYASSCRLYVSPYDQYAGSYDL
jgi:hypothetical protein